MVEESTGPNRRQTVTHSHVSVSQIDRCYGWQSTPNAPFREALEKQDENTKREFYDRTERIIVQLKEQVRVCERGGGRGACMDRSVSAWRGGRERWMHVLIRTPPQPDPPPSTLPENKALNSEPPP